ncbi:endonuclease III [Desulfonatronovibrio hydrogenovorans]|uniref:endonuclease III n=1 Tax=Desulfonatronovibrio hydrogenovorans TaxID=53245 RepID=UPI00048D98E9|nr:endonuclease III [Desulfonatronovibrio hydrogenovorans]
MNRPLTAPIILNRLKSRYSSPETALNWENPWQLLVATVLSAQSTDKQVNRITPLFFKKWPAAHDLARASLEEVEDAVRSAGFFRTKSRNLLATSRIIVSRFNGRVPDTMKDLLVLPGVARKTANIILFNAFGKNEGIAVDTHVKRISFRLGLTEATNPDSVEKDLIKLFPRKEWGNINHMLVFFGREVCKARKPLCHECELEDICPRTGV